MACIMATFPSRQQGNGGNSFARTSGVESHPGQSLRAGIACVRSCTVAQTLLGGHVRIVKESWPVGAGATPCDRINENFAHAVEAAIDDARDKRNYLRELLLQRYGANDGGLIICALTSRARIQW